MKKLLIIALILWGCEDAPTEHTHDGICIYKYHEPSLNSFYYTCLSTYQETDCMDKIVAFNDENNEAVECSTDYFSGSHQWILSASNSAVYITVDQDENPNLSTSRIGFIYPWAKRPALKERELMPPYRDEYEYEHVYNDRMFEVIISCRIDLRVFVLHL